MYITIDVPELLGTFEFVSTPKELTDAIITRLKKVNSLDVQFVLLRGFGRAYVQAIRRMMVEHINLTAYSLEKMLGNPEHDSVLSDEDTLLDIRNKLGKCFGKDVIYPDFLFMSAYQVAWTNYVGAIKKLSRHRFRDMEIILDITGVTDSLWDSTTDKHVNLCTKISNLIADMTELPYDCNWDILVDVEIGKKLGAPNLIVNIKEKMIFDQGWDVIHLGAQSEEVFLQNLSDIVKDIKDDVLMKKHPGNLILDIHNWEYSQYWENVRKETIIGDPFISTYFQLVVFHAKGR